MYSTHLILKVIINRRPLTLRHTLLLPIHFNHLSRTRRHIRLLIIPDLNKPRKPQTNALLSPSLKALLTSSLIPRTERQIGSLNLPDDFGLEPDVGLVRAAG